jgi:hypothetical protein
MTKVQEQQFINMACELSPENLHCDGEISQAAAGRKYRQIMSRWHKLEAEVGRTVSEDEAWDFAIKKSKKTVIRT